MCEETNDPGAGGVTYDSTEPAGGCSARDGPVHK